MNQHHLHIYTFLLPRLERKGDCSPAHHKLLQHTVLGKIYASMLWSCDDYKIKELKQYQVEYSVHVLKNCPVLQFLHTMLQFLHKNLTIVNPFPNAHLNKCFGILTLCILEIFLHAILDSLISRSKKGEFKIIATIYIIY